MNQLWQNRVDALRANDPKLPWMEIHRLCGECPWPQPAGNPSPFKPANLYHAMIRRVAPYAIRGFLYYQGEADVERCHDYADISRGAIQYKIPCGTTITSLDMI